MNEQPLLFLAAALGLILLLILLHTLQKRAGVPKGQMIYNDLGSSFTPARTLYSAQYRLSGKPDLIFRSQDGLVPLELKSAQAPQFPYDSHVQQLMAYCLLIESCYGKTPPYGIIQYHNKSFKISYTNQRKERLLRIMQQMREDLPSQDLARSHQIPSRCRFCPYRKRCDQKIS